jgi:hypothetical protein
MKKPTSKIPEGTKALIRTFAVSFVASDGQSPDLAGWLRLKFFCDRPTAQKYADWWEGRRL